jgi:hypothetical protein
MAEYAFASCVLQVVEIRYEVFDPVWIAATHIPND